MNSPASSNLILNSPVARALAVMGDRWAGLILRDVFLGVSQFEEFRRRGGVARGTLSSRLRSLVENEILYKKPYQQSPTRHGYRLTRKGLDLYPFVLAVWDWETRWSSESHIPPTLTHTRCGATMRPVFRCGACHLPIRMREVSFQPGASPGEAENIPARFQRRSPSRGVSEEGVDRRFFHVLDIIGDRWTGLVIAAFYFGLNRFDDIASALGIATNILTDRLKLLVSAEVLQRIPYQENPIRHEYRLTEKGADLYTHVLQMHEWAVRWLLDRGEAPLKLKHKPCGKDLHSEMVCSECLEPLKTTETRFDPDFE